MGGNVGDRSDKDSGSRGGMNMHSICGKDVLLENVEMECKCDECRCKMYDIMKKGKVENGNDVIVDAVCPFTEIVIVSKCPRGDEFAFYVHKSDSDIAIDVCDDDNNTRTYIQRHHDYFKH